MTLTAAILASLVVLTTTISPSGVSAKNAGHCPPGLAKKNLPCVPPGQAKKGFSVGDRFPDGYYLVPEPSKYRLPGLGPNEGYYRVDDTFFRINRETREILQLFNALGAVLN